VICSGQSFSTDLGGSSNKTSETLVGRRMEKGSIWIVMRYGWVETKEGISRFYYCKGRSRGSVYTPRSRPPKVNPVNILERRGGFLFIGIRTLVRRKEWWHGSSGFSFLMNKKPRRVYFRRQGWELKEISFLFKRVSKDRGEELVTFWVVSFRKLTWSYHILVCLKTHFHSF